MYSAGGVGGRTCKGVGGRWRRRCAGRRRAPAAVVASEGAGGGVWLGLGSARDGDGGGVGGRGRRRHAGSAWATTVHFGLGDARDRHRRGLAASDSPRRAGRRWQQRGRAWVMAAAPRFCSKLSLVSGLLRLCLDREWRRAGEGTSFYTLGPLVPVGNPSRD
jgi:hypothetical protein